MSNVTRDELLTRYLTPLLEKHERNETIVWEDLMHAKHSADAALQSSDSKEAQKEAEEELQQLHKSQVALYREQAAHALLQWCQTWKLPDPTEDETHMQYVQRCLTRAFDERPFWKLGTGMLQKILSPPIKKRTEALYLDMTNRRRRKQDDEVKDALNAEESDGEIGEEDEVDGEDEELDGAGDTEDGEAGNEETHPKANTAGKSTLASKAAVNKKKVVPVKKTIQRKKRPAAVTTDKLNQPRKVGAKKRGRGGATATGAASSNK
ncbi:hypothetical protein MPSEU_000540700 [Mayamaea pseudoterrestris]|nr:hypothetical protein MPSEU_000540700 [Mayamaea pseudoterrestris]